jgi:hypothetical protein
MADYYVYASDDSGSTEHDSYYHSNALDTVQKFKDEVDTMSAASGRETRVVYLHWGSLCFEVDERAVVERYKRQYGNGGGTCPQAFISYIQENICKKNTNQDNNFIQKYFFKKTMSHDNNLKLLYIITDGEILQRDVQTCNNQMLKRPFKFERVVFHAINRNEHMIDLSVASVILKDAECRVYCNTVLKESVNLSEAYDYDAVVPENFEEKKSGMISYIRLQFITSKPTDVSVLDEIKKLKNMRNRLLQHKTEAAYTAADFDTKDRAQFIKTFKQTEYFKMLYGLEYSYHANVDKCISTLLNYLHNDKKSFAFDNLRVHDYYSELPPLPDNVDASRIDYASVEQIEFPDYILDDEVGVPAILLTHCNLMLSLNTTHSLTKFKKLIEFPLFFKYNKHMKRSIEQFYNLKSFRKLLATGTTKAPFTRAEFTGAIVPAPEFDDYNDWVLCKTYFEGKQVPFNRGLMYYVLYAFLLECEYMNKSVVEYFRNYAIHRIKTTKCTIGFSTQPLEPQLIVSLPAALWYSVDIATQIFGNDSIFFGKERLRAFAAFAHDMIVILKWCGGYAINEPVILERAQVFATINTLKRKQGHNSKLYYLLAQVFESTQGFLVHKIKNKEAIKMLNLLHVDHTKILDVSIINRPVDLNDYAYFYNRMLLSQSYDIDTRTMRPRFCCGENNFSYYDSLLRLSENVTADENNYIKFCPTIKLNLRKTVSLYKLYLAYVELCLAYPLLDDYKDFVRDKCGARDNKIGIFSENIPYQISMVWQQYRKFQMPIAEFIARSKASTNRIERVLIENDYKMITTNAAVEYVAVASKRVNLCT